MAKERIDKILSSQGFGSRKEVQTLIKRGFVVVDNTIVKKIGEKFDPEADIITVMGKPINFKKNIYIMMNKPAGVISASMDPTMKTVLDLLPKHLHRKGLFPAGRLDRNTEGLLIITNDGDFAHKMLSPKNKVYKKYEAIIDGTVTETQIQQFENGITLQNGISYKPARLNIIESGSRSIVEVTICEGKFHQIKRMFVAVGMHVIYLKRIKIGNLYLDPCLKLGECKELSELEINSMFRSCT